MVKICSNIYPESSEIKYNDSFTKYPFPLSSFQKYSIEAIVEGHHVLVCVPTGSGKTLPGEFAIEHFVKQGKKVIYTSPIKALSNQKFYDFSVKFPNISFGILTGDIKFNPEADVLIMTAEILQNTLYKNKSSFNNIATNNIVSSTTFEMDFNTELGCVIMDEVHYINDADRGKVWEETIMMLPYHIQMVMLSATLDSPEIFAHWCENRGADSFNKDDKKIVYLTPSHERIVPLTHYSFITCNTGIFKAIKDKTTQQEIMKITNRLHVLQNAKGHFQDENYKQIYKTLQLFESKNHFVKRSHVLNKVSEYMVENTMLPAICFVFSRKNLEICAKEITTNLLEFDSKVPYIIKNECEQIIRKLPNYKEYLYLPEYVQMVSLLEKGIAIHHAGVMPVLREMVELLFSKGYIKLLFATETFAVGINMPTKTVLFTDVNKFDGNSLRLLYSHEYTQMAGRAGRRGIDTVGNVIHLNNLFKNIETVNYKIMMKGDPQKLVSKFKISYNLLLNLIDIGNHDFSKFAKQSMIQGNVDNQLKGLYIKISSLSAEIDKLEQSINFLSTPKNIVDEYISLTNRRLSVVNSKRKEIDRKIKNLLDTYKFIESDTKIVMNINTKYKMYQEVQDEISGTEMYVDKNVLSILTLLTDFQYIKQNEDNLYNLTLSGKIASQIREVHCVLFTNLLVENKLDLLDATDLVALFSCFTNCTVPEKLSTNIPFAKNKDLEKLLLELIENNQQLQDTELRNNVETGITCDMHYNLISYMYEWCECDDITTCKLLLQKMSIEKEIFLGEFIKSILKINNIVNEMIRVSEMMGNIKLLHNLKEIPQKTLKYIATNQSLYI
jgi:superfamily II RNA helicase